MRKKSMKQRVFAVALATAFAFSPAFPSFTAFAASETMEDASEAKGAVTDEKISIKDSYAQGQVTEWWTFSYNNEALKPVATTTKKVQDYEWTWEGDKYVYKPTTYTYEETYNYSYSYPVYTWTSKWNSETGKYEYFIGEGTATAYDTWIPEMEIMIFDSGDRTKPDGGKMSKDRTGKYVVDNGYTSRDYSDPKNVSNPKYEFDIDADDLNPGKKDVVGYIFNEPAYREAYMKAASADQKAYYTAYIEYEKAYDKWVETSTGTAPEAPDSDDYKENVDKISEADYYVTTNVVNIEVAMAARIATSVKTTSVELSLHASGATGYEIYRKAGKKYIKIATVASSKYVDKGLTSNTTYAYKVRPYYVNRYTGATSYGKYTTTEVTTTGSALRVNATVTSKNKVKLTWKKVTGATKYQIYKVDTTNMATIEENTGGYGVESNSFSASKLIATVKKNKKSYTDKDVLADRSYSYMVRAVLPKNGKKSRYVDCWADVSIEFGELTNVTITEDAFGNKTVKWNQVYGAAGYLVEKNVDYYKEDVAYYNSYELKYNASTGKIYYVNDDDETINRFSITGDKVYRLYSDGTPYSNASYKKSGNVIYEYDENENRVYGPVYVISGSNVYRANEDGSIHYVLDYSEWETFKKLGKTATSVKLPATKTVNKNKETETSTDYRIRAYKGNVYGESLTVETEVTCGVVSKVTATKAANGIKVTWSKVSGAAYYRVYRVPTDVLVKNNDIGAYDNPYSSQVTEYVDVKTPVKVDVAAWNATVNKSIADYKAASEAEEKIYQEAVNKYYNGETSVYPDYNEYHKVNYNDYFDKYDRLDEKKEYYYQNYSYERDIFTDADAATGIIDYCGDIYAGSDDVAYIYTDSNNKLLTNPIVMYRYYPVVNAEDVDKSACKSGVSYTYYVVAYMGTKKTAADYKGTNAYSDTYYTDLYEHGPAYDMSITGPQLPVKYTYGDNDTYYSQGGKYAKKVKVVTTYNFKDVYGHTVGCKTVGTATFTETKAPAKPTLKSVKASKGKVTIAIKKKVKDADYYKVYRSTKKKGAYSSVGVTSNAKTLKFTDTSAKKGTKYFYKVVAVKKNEANGEVESKASAVKSVKAK